MTTVTVCNPPKRARTRKALLDVAAAVTEAHVQEAVVQFMELDGWRAIRTDPVSDRKRGKGFGEPGMPDYLFVRYCFDPKSEPGQILERDNWRTSAYVLWVEFKRPGAKPKPHQEQWHAAERARGALVLTVDDIDAFQAYYLNSGLNRRLNVGKRQAAAE